MGFLSGSVGRYVIALVYIHAIWNPFSYKCRILSVQYGLLSPKIQVGFRSRKCGCCMVRLQSTYGVAIQARGQSRDCENVAMAESASSCSLDYSITNDSSE